MSGFGIIRRRIDKRASYENRKISKEDGHGNRDNGGIFRLFLYNADKHRLNEYFLYEGPQKECAKGNDENTDIPVTDSQKKDNQKILKIGADHEELAYGPVDHFHNSIDKIDPKGH